MWLNFEFNNLTRHLSLCYSVLNGTSYRDFVTCSVVKFIVINLVMFKNKND